MEKEHPMRFPQAGIQHYPSMHHEQTQALRLDRFRLPGGSRSILGELTGVQPGCTRMAVRNGFPLRGKDNGRGEKDRPSCTMNKPSTPLPKHLARGLPSPTSSPVLQVFPNQKTGLSWQRADGFPPLFLSFSRPTVIAAQLVPLVYPTHVQSLAVDSAPCPTGHFPVSAPKAPLKK